VDIAFGEYLRFLFALLFVLGLIGGFALVAKRFGLGNRGPTTRGAAKRLGIVETMALDAKRRLLLVRRDDTEHLILIGASGEQVIESTIVPPADAVRDKTPLERPNLQAVPPHPVPLRTEVPR
jgi:flagellar protein FliO/FliZ